MSNNRTKKETYENDAILNNVAKLLSKKKEDQILLLRSLFKYGYPNFPLESFSVPREEIQKVLKIRLDELRIIFQDTPSLVHWVHGGLFKSNESIPMALLFIEWYEQHPFHQDNAECDFREIYHFLYKLTMNQVPAAISEQSAQVLHTIITEVLNEAWLDKQQELFTYCSEIFKYRRTLHRRVYQGKKRISKKEQNMLNH
ncbi:uncharacterized protein LOC105184012 isoform X1 [Harpegnathos saltator]|uniref:uncharacterized protein LOC105184012 isoform X1 n=2 Tax=Harpegnathos saltator TaxID=610380 RepID=UPI000948A4AB|nr:uncharacterized protein LOC105184012 isoform X1 [Harpegnathos saltator]XP_019697393.1 uncharacterized protein LOC105184012 isoform X1 [Harpegnathos saltator]